MRNWRKKISERTISGWRDLRMKSGRKNIQGRENIQGRVIIFVMTALLFLWSSGCTEYERSGYSAIPQNSPAGWELAPYGDLRN